MSQVTALKAAEPNLQLVRWMLVCAGGLLVLGVIMIGSASIDVSAEKLNQPFYYFIRHLSFVITGIVIGLVMYAVPVASWKKNSWILMAIAFALLLAVLIPGVGKEVNGGRRWIPLGIISVQASELAKLFLMAYLASYCVRRRDELVASWKGFLKPMGVLVLASSLLFLEPDLGAAVVLMGAALGMMFLSGVALARFGAILGSVLAAAVLMIIMTPFRMKRMIAYTDPWADQYNTGYQLTQSLIAFGRGDWFGVGLGNSIQKLFFLPEAHTDFVFAIVAEELGLFGSLGVLAAFIGVVSCGLLIGRRAEVHGLSYHAAFAYGITLLLSLQAFINMGVSTGLLPTKGLTLPLVSYGGSSLLVSCVSIAVLARIANETLLVAKSRQREKPQ